MKNREKTTLVSLPVDIRGLKESQNIGAILLKNTNCKIYVKRGSNNENS